MLCTHNTPRETQLLNHRAANNSGRLTQGQTGAATFLINELRRSGLLANVIDLYPCLGVNLAGVRCKLVVPSNSTSTFMATTGTIADSDLVSGSNGGWKATAGGLNTNYNPSTQNTGNEATFGMWAYTPDTMTGTTAKVTIGAYTSGSDDNQCHLAYLNTNAGWGDTGTIGGQALNSGVYVSRTGGATGLLGVQRKGAARCFWYNNSTESAQNPSDITKNFPNTTFYLNSASASGTASFYANREIRFAAFTTGLGSRYAEWYNAIQGFQRYLNRHV